MIKVCKTCSHSLDVSFFYAKSAAKDGYENVCKSCKKDQYAKRYLKNKDIVLARNAKWRAANADRMKALNDKHYQDNKDRIGDMRKQRYLRDKESVSAYAVTYYRENKESYKARYERYYSTHKSMYVIRSRARANQIKVSSFPDQRDAINAFYAACPEGFHVDHIVPLKNPKVNGLHVLANLRYLPAEENLRKRNKFYPELGWGGI